MAVTSLSHHRSRSRQRLCMRCGELPAAVEVRRELAWVPPAGRLLLAFGAPGLFVAYRCTARQAFVYDTCLGCEGRAPRRRGDLACLVLSVALHLAALVLAFTSLALALTAAVAAYALARRALSPPPDLHVVQGEDGHRFISLHASASNPLGGRGDIPLFFPQARSQRIPVTRCPLCGHVNRTHYGACMRCRRPLDGRLTQWIEAA